MGKSERKYFPSFYVRDNPSMKSFIIFKRFSKDEVILYEEDTSRYMYIIYSGKVKVVQVSEDGKEHILAIHKAGDFFGEMALLDGKTSPATVVAMEDTEIGLISKEVFENYLFMDKTFMQEIISMLCKRLRDAWLMIRVLSFADAEKRVRAVLKNISTQYGIKKEEGIMVNLKLTHKDIADYASVSRETVTRFIDKFVKSGEVEIYNKYLLLKPSFFKNISYL